MARSRKVEADAPPRVVEGRVMRLGAQGEGVLDFDGERIFAPLTAPGDVVRAEARGARGRLLELLEAGPSRAAPPCAHYGVCGGCALQHVDAATYLAFKRQRLVDALTRVRLGDAPVSDVIELPAATRRRATFAVRRTRSGAIVGFHERRQERVTAVPGCVVLHPELARRMQGLAALAGLVNASSFDLAVTLCANGLDVDFQGSGVDDAPESLAEAMRAAGAVRISINGDVALVLDAPVVEFGGLPISPPPGAFLQASKEGETALLDLVKAAVGDAGRIADLFSGCGTFALPLAGKATVAAFDSQGAAIEALRAAAKSAQARGLTHPLHVERRDLAERPLSPAELDRFDAVIFDPPRAGAREQAEALAQSRVPTVVGVSCNPATFARDAATLAAGGYILERATPVDQFVYSAHIEIVGVFRKG